MEPAAGLPAIIIASIAAVSAIVTTWIARSTQKTARHTHQQVQTGNGRTLVHAIEAMGVRLEGIAARVDLMSDRLDGFVHKHPTRDGRAARGGKSK